MYYTLAPLCQRRMANPVATRTKEDGEVDIAALIYEIEAGVDVARHQK